MSQQEPSPHSRSAIIADLAGVISEVAVLQERQAALNTATAAVQGRLAEMVHKLSGGTSITTQARLNEADVRRMQELLQRSPRGSLVLTEGDAPATQAASPPGASPVVQAEGQPVQVGKGSDAEPEGVPGKSTSGQSEQFGARAGAGGESVASADTAPAADAKPKRTFPQPLPEKKPSEQMHLPVEPVVPRRELTAGGGLVQGGPVPKRPYIDGTIINLVIERYHAESEAAGDIDCVLNLEPGTARIVIDEARMKRDERVQEADRASAAKLSRETAPRERPPAARAAPKPEPVKVSTPLPLDFGERAPAGDTDPVIIVDKKGRRIIGPTGEWKPVTGLVADCLGVLADGEMRGVDRMLRACSGFTKDTQIVQCLPNWKVSLARIGIDLVHIKGIGVRLNRAKVAA